VRTKVILNPYADHGRAIESADSIRKKCQVYAIADLSLTENAGQATELARDAIDKGYDLVIAAGGDGTIHEIVNGLMVDGRSEANLGLLPIGSGNDFASGLGLYSDLDSAIKNIFTGSARLIDVAHIADDRGRQEYVANGLGIGFDATVSIQSRTITRVHGFALYALAALRTIAFYYQTPHLKIQFDDDFIEQYALLLAVGVGPRIGGGFYLTPDAIFDDGLLDSCLVDPMNRASMLRLLPEAMRGTHVSSHYVTMRRNHRIELTSDIALPIHVDGEIFAYHEDNVRQVSITAIQSALPVMHGDR